MGRFLTKRYQHIILILIVLIVGFFVIFAYRRWIATPAYTIQTITIDSSSNQLYRHPTLPQLLQTTLSWSNYRRLKWRRKSQITPILQLYPEISSIKMQQVWPSHIQVSVVYGTPKLVLQAGAQFWVVIAWITIPVTMSDTITRGFPLVQLVGTRSGLQNLDGIFWGVSDELLATQIAFITKTIPQYKSLQYIVGGEKVVVTTDRIQMSFDVTKNFFEQYRKYATIIQNFPRASQIISIDLGSLDDASIIQFPPDSSPKRSSGR